MEPIEYLRVVRRRWKPIALIVLVGLAAAWFTTPGQRPRELRATQTLIGDSATASRGSDEGGRANGSKESQASLKRYALLATRGDVPARVAQRIGFTGTTADLGARVKATAETEVGTITMTSTTMTSTQTGAVDAGRLVDAFANELIASLDGQNRVRYEEEVAAASARLAGIQTRLREIEARIGPLPPADARAALASQPSVLLAEREALSRQFGEVFRQVQDLRSAGPPTSGLRLLGPATVTPVEGEGFSLPSGKFGRMALTGSMALVLGAGLALVAERLDTRIRTKDMAERAFGLPVMAEVPAVSRRWRRSNEVLTVTRPDSLVADAHRRLMTQLQLMVPLGPQGPAADVAADRSGGDGGTPGGGAPSGEGPMAPPYQRSLLIVVTSPGPSEGKTSTSANLAASFAETGKTVLVVDCDFRRPQLHRYLRVREGPSLTNVAANGGPVDPSQLCRSTWVPGVLLLRSGESVGQPGEFVARELQVLRELRNAADVIIVDTPPLLTANDASELATVADAVAMVSRTGATTRESASRAAELLQRLGAPVVGVVLVGAPQLSSSRHYYYRQEATRWRRALGRLRRAGARRDGASSISESQGAGPSAQREPSPALVESRRPVQPVPAAGSRPPVPAAGSQPPVPAPQAEERPAAAVSAAAAGNGQSPRPHAATGEPVRRTPSRRVLRSWRRR